MALTAVPVGFVAGLFGIGGGLITVPFLYYIFGSLGIDQQYIMHLAVGTSFAIIIPTSIVSVLTHHKFNAVDFNVVKKDRKSTRLNSSHDQISYAVFCLKKKNIINNCITFIYFYM